MFDVALVFLCYNSGPGSLHLVALFSWFSVQFKLEGTTLNAVTKLFPCDSCVFVVCSWKIGNPGAVMKYVLFGGVHDDKEHSLRKQVIKIHIELVR